MKPLVSILIPAYNMQEWITESLASAVSQTWPRKEIIVVDDGSTDRTAEIASRFASKEVKIVSTENRGVAAACNMAYQLCRGDYIQWLGADDLLAPDKIERQIAALRSTDTGRVLLSCPWAYFYYRTSRARFQPNSLWCDLAPVEWLYRKMSENLHMQPATWLTSRELADAAGPEDSRLLFDDDGEYYCRVIMASEGTRFVRESKVYYRVTGTTRVSYIGISDKKRDSLLLSMKLHIRYLRSMEDSERVRKACLTYMQTWYDNFYPERPEFVAELHEMAGQLHGRLSPPRLRWKYSWMRPIFGWKAAKWAQRTLPQWKRALLAKWDRAMYLRELRAKGDDKRSDVWRLPQES